MKKYIYNYACALILLASCFFSFQTQALQKQFVIVVLTYNNEKWCIQNLESILEQDYDSYRVIIINDCSTDRTRILLDEYIKQKSLQNRITIIHNSQRLGSVVNHYTAAHLCKPDEIIVHLDGDDFFPTKNLITSSRLPIQMQVLQKLNQIYSNPHIWLTYGQYVTYPRSELGLCEAFPQNIVINNAFRDYKWISSHLRSFYASLFHKIKVSDFLDVNGQPFSCCPDVAFMFPLLEMAGVHTYFNSEIMYIYNMSNPLNEFNFDLNNRLRIDKVIRSKPRYQPLKNLSL